MAIASINSGNKEKLLQLYARLGLAAHGVVYCLMAGLSLAAALGLNNKKADKSGAFKFILEQPFGKIILFIIGFCMLGYVLLRLFQTFKDTRNKGNSAKGLAKRFLYFWSALTYMLLSVYCFKLVFHKDDSGDSKKFFVARLLEMPAGELLVGAIALIFAIAAVYQIYFGCRKKFMKNIDLYHSKYQETFQKVGIIGYSARGVVFGIISYLFFRAAIEANSKLAAGTGEAFDFMQQKFGNILLGIICVGLLAFGIFMFVRARHEKMHFDVD